VTCVRGPSTEVVLTRGDAQPSGEVRSRRTSPEGALSPRARGTSPEGVHTLVAVVGHGGHQGRDRVVCAFWARGLVFVLHFLRDEVGFPRLFRRPLWLSPTICE
jgi:hypothetical protein